MSAEMPNMATFPQVSNSIGISYNNEYSNTATVPNLPAMEAETVSSNMTTSCFSPDTKQTLTISSAESMPTTSSGTSTKITTSTAENKETNLEGLGE